MHLDTIFNILNYKEVVWLDFNTIPPKFKNGIELDLRRRVSIFRWRKQDENKSNGVSYGLYELIKEIDFERFLLEQNIAVYKITHRQQL